MDPTLPQATGDMLRYAILDQGVVIYAEGTDAPWRDRLDRLLALFPATGEGAATGVCISVSAGQDGALWQIAQDGALTPAYSDNALLREVEQRAFAAAVRQALLPLVLHAGAVVRDGMALLLPAASGAGKSTLTLALARQGWLPLTDDICPLARAGDAWIALPCPRCCHLSVEAVGALCASEIALDGPVADLAGYYRPAAWGASAPVRAIAVPRFVPGAAPRAARLTQAECLAALISASFDQVNQPGSARRVAARQLAARAPGFHLTYASVDDALRLVDTVVDELACGDGMAGTDQTSVFATYPA